MKLTRKVILIIMAVLNIVLIIATIILYSKNKNLEYILYCIIILTSSIAASLPLYYKSKE